MLCNFSEYFSGIAILVILRDAVARRQHNDNRKTADHRCSQKQAIQRHVAVLLDKQRDPRKERQNKSKPEQEFGNAFELWNGCKVPDEIADKAYELLKSRQNIT